MKKFFTILVMCFAVLAAKAQVTVILEAHDVWGDGSGYQLLLDADATAFGTIIPETGALTSSGDADAATYAEFEYKIPENADGALTTTNMVYDGSVEITIPAGTYDFCVTNPTPGARMWIAGTGRQDDYVFQDGYIYHFTVAREGSGDGVTIEIINTAVAMAPTSFTAVPAADHTLSVDLSWTNPTTTCGGSALTALTSVVLTRNGETIQTFTAPTVGGEMTFTDNTMTADGAYEYSVYAVTDAGNGVEASARAIVGNVCEHRIVMEDSYGDGWDASAIEIYSGSTLIGSYTCAAESAEELVPLAPGEYTFSWVSGSQYDSEASFVIYDAYNVPIYTSNGTPAAGTFFTYTNTCEAQEPYVTFDGTTEDFAAAVNDYSIIQGVVVKSLGLTSTLTVSASTMYEVSLDGETFATSVTVDAGADYNEADLYIRFAPTAAGTQAGTITATDGTLTATLNVNGEGVVCETISNFPYTCEFDRGSTDVVCWNIEDANGDGSTFKFFDFDEEGNTGVAAYMYNSTNSAEDWLISPEFAISENLDVTFAYRCASSNYPERLSAYVIPAGSTYANAVQILPSTTVENTTWESTTLSLADYAGQTIRVAFKAESDANMYWLAIDHFQIAQSTGIEEETAENAVAIYPNPATTMLNVHAENFDNVQVINFLGQVVYSANVTENDFQINVSNLSNGVYFIRLNGENTVTKKFVKR